MERGSLFCKSANVMFSCSWQSLTFRKWEASIWPLDHHHASIHTCNLTCCVHALYTIFNVNSFQLCVYIACVQIFTVSVRQISMCIISTLVFFCFFFFFCAFHFHFLFLCVWTFKSQMLGGDPMRILCPQGLVTIAVNIPASARPSLSQGADAFDKMVYNFVCFCWCAYNH